ncbi:MAG: hypothetical protein E7503_03595 [Ruminococcus sp.]|nr:hypothetical protein [Ruminococcus sp.]
MAIIWLIFSGFFAFWGYAFWVGGESLSEINMGCALLIAATICLCMTVVHHFLSKIFKSVQETEQSTRALLQLEIEKRNNTRADKSVASVHANTSIPSAATSSSGRGKPWEK